MTHLSSRVHRPSGAMVVALLALFVALGGSSYAVVTLSKGQVKGKHIAKNAITTTKVKDGSLRSRDFETGQLDPTATPTPYARFGLNPQAARFVVGNNVWNPIPFDIEVEDPDDLHSPAAPTDIVVKQAGVYVIVAEAQLYGSHDNAWTLMLVNGDSRTIAISTGDGAVVQQVHTVTRLGAGETIRAVLIHTSGSDRVYAGQAPTLSLARIGA